ncbi:alpha/beta hydrolase fold domain-containing protein [Sinomicrobium sp. M5D2P9]
MFAQEKIEAQPYTVQTTFEKLRKYYPTVTPVAELHDDGVIARENITYRKVDGIWLNMDIYTPAGKEKESTPAILLVHGGGWVSGTKENQRVMAQCLAKNGFVAATVSYRLSSQAPYPAAVLDIKAAVRWLREKSGTYGIDPDRIAISGASAGAQLATLVGVTPGNPLYKEGKSRYSDAVQAIINTDGIVSFVHPEAEEGKYAAYWLGGTKAEKAGKWKEASPLEYVNENTPPTLFINSAQPRFHAGRDDMIEILEKHGIYNEVHTIPDSPHSFWLLHPWFETTLNYNISFLDKVFKK